ncbi:HlyD family secretion protein [Salipiger mangrovisoli]|uniref:HlyD family secretion protein n=1 Tax=Salipiger mangrovisoli TaxID=2865933 RepID=A0ABR9XAK0_9RHOB|nr:HlyD family secretion protein [Salipiger mangrovisoli]MBE9640527.1 HlyD family secretion protein [Salipiger mangrovisoli]
MRHAKAPKTPAQTITADPRRIVEPLNPSSEQAKAPAELPRPASVIPDEGDQPTAAESPTPKKRSRLKPILVVAAASAALALAARTGEQWWTVGRFIESTEDAYLQADIVSLATQVEGTVAALPFADNARVKAGDVLLTLDPTTFEARLQSAQSDVAVAQAALSNVDAKEALQRARIASAEAEVRNAEAQRDLAITRDGRTQSLVKKGAVAQATADDAAAALEGAEAALRKARAALQVEEGQMDILASERTQQQASLVRAKAAERLARIDLDNTTILAPRDGIAGNIGIAEGEYLRAGTRFMSLVPTGDDIYVTANFKETQVAAFRPGMPVEIEVDMLHGAPLHGTIQSLAPATGSEFSVLPTDNATGNFTKIVQRIPVRIHLTDAGDHPLRAGASVVVNVDTREGTGAHK